MYPLEDLKKRMSIHMWHICTHDICVPPMHVDARRFIESSTKIESYVFASSAPGTQLRRTDSISVLRRLQSIDGYVRTCYSLTAESFPGFRILQWTHVHHYHRRWKIQTDVEGKIKSRIQPDGCRWGLCIDNWTHDQMSTKSQAIFLESSRIISNRDNLHLQDNSPRNKVATLDDDGLMPWAWVWGSRMFLCKLQVKCQVSRMGLFWQRIWKHMISNASTTRPKHAQGKHTFSYVFICIIFVTLCR